MNDESSQYERDVIKLSTLVEMQGEQMKAVLEQMREQSKVQSETNIGLNRLTDEISHMTKSHDTLARDTREQFKAMHELIEEKKLDSNKKIQDVSERVITLEKVSYADSGWRETKQSIVKTVAAAVVLSVLAVIGFKLK